MIGGEVVHQDQLAVIFPTCESLATVAEPLKDRCGDGGFPLQKVVTVAMDIRPILPSS